MKDEEFFKKGLIEIKNVFWEFVAVVFFCFSTLSYIDDLIRSVKLAKSDRFD